MIERSQWEREYHFSMKLAGWALLVAVAIWLAGQLPTLPPLDQVKHDYSDDLVIAR